MRAVVQAWAGPLACAAVLGAAPAAASGLQVAPVAISLTASESADGLTLSNVGESTVHAQVRVFHWRQDGEGEHLERSDGLVISPPMIALEPGDVQLIRVIRTQPAPAAGASEDAYRIVIDELPTGRVDRDKGLEFVLRYSLPVFIEPAGQAVPESLQWHLANLDGRIAVVVANGGGRHAQIADIVLRWPDGRHTVLAPGLVGYALPGASRTWGTAEPWPASTPAGMLEVRVNGQQVQHALPVAPAPG